MTAYKKLERLQKALAECDDVFNALQKMVGLDCHGRLYGAVTAITNVAIAATAESVGVEPEALDWFIYENDFGAKRMVCQRGDHPEVAIDSIEAFLAFEGIVETSE